MQIRPVAFAGWAVLILVVTWGCTELSDDHKVHPDNWSIEHQAKIRIVGYDLISCKSCHGDDLAGSDEVLGCSSGSSGYCHQVGTGQSVLDAIYACNNCHGYVEDIPFKDVTGNSSPDVVTVGAHTSHYTHPDSLTVNVDCASCHLVPDSVWAEGHIDTSLYAEVIFDTLATNDNSLTPVWDRQNATCTDTYCHGAFDFDGITGKDSIWVWTTPAAGDLCGTCHGLPPDGHRTISEGANCGPCHSGVVDLDSEDNYFITPDGLSKHINGVKNVFGN